MKITLKENDRSGSVVCMRNMECNTLYKFDCNGLCVRLSDDVLLFIDECNKFELASMKESGYDLDNYMVIKLHNVKIDISFDY